MKAFDDLLASSPIGTDLGVVALRAELARHDGPLGIAFSGGPDSHAVLAWALEGLRHDPVLLHVHHGLGPGSDEALAAVEQVARQHQLELRTKRVRVVPRRRGLEAAAREARYKALQTLAPRGMPIALGHGWDDWVESLWLRLLSGSSPLYLMMSVVRS